MRPALSALILLLCIASLPAGIHGEFLVDQSPCSQVAIVETEADTLQVDHTADLSTWPPLMKGLTKRGKGTFSFVAAPPLCVTDPDPHPLAHARPSSLAAVHQAAPLYQTLHVLRF
jgi:hypothetical protein